MLGTRILVPLSTLAALTACGGATPRTTPPTRAEVVDMEELRITAHRSEDGDLELDSYDAETLFTRATDLLNRRRCADAVVLYDRLVDEFPTSRYRSPALYNAGLCLQDIGEREAAVTHYERLLRDEPRSPDVKHASFQLAQLRVELERWDDAVALADTLLARDDLSPDERLEAMARRAQALLGGEQLDDAARQARTAVIYYRTRPEEQQIRDEFFAAASNFVLAETFRHGASAIHIPQAAVEQQRDVLEARARLMLEAQREYFNTMSFTNAHWAAAAGYRIGEMYDTFWGEITSAPTPPPRNPLPPGTEAVYEDEYRRELARLVEPLMRHAIRYWELTLMMIERTGVESDWTARVRSDLDRARQRLVADVSGRGGAAPDAPTPAPAPAPAPNEGAGALGAPH
jgi:hypothetical protein